jgi:hypothetical protein
MEKEGIVVGCDDTATPGEPSVNNGGVLSVILVVATLLSNEADNKGNLDWSADECVTVRFTSGEWTVANELFEIPETFEEIRVEDEVLETDALLRDDMMKW